MNEQEMQFADPEWKPMTGNSHQDKDRIVQSGLPRARKSQAYDSSQSASTFSSYDQGYQGYQRQLPPIPYIAPVSPQTQSRPAPVQRRRPRLWIWVIIAIIAIYMFGGLSSFRSNNNYPAPPYHSQNMSTYSSFSYDLTGVSHLRINNDSGRIQVQVGGGRDNMIFVNDAIENQSASTDSSGLMTLSIQGDATIILPPNMAASLQLTTQAGDIVVSGYKGQLSAESSDASIFLNNCELADQSIIHSGTGQIHFNLSRVSGTAALTSDSGNIVFEQANLNGDVTISAKEDGNIYFTGTLEQSGKYHFSTENGNMDLAFPSKTSLHVNVSKGENGYYQNDLDNDNNGSTTPPTSIDVKTDSGTITIHRQS